MKKVILPIMIVVLVIHTIYICTRMPISNIHTTEIMCWVIYCFIVMGKLLNDISKSYD